jgi:RNA polymerase sigma factor (sigma-70 family)
MADALTFDELIRRVRAGDEEAAAILVKRYESAIRRAVRFRLADAGLGSLLDSMDICQSVLGSFFVRAASGQFELKNPGQLLRLLTAMARNKLNSQARKQLSLRRDIRRVESRDQCESPFVATGESLSTIVAARDLLQEVHRRLSPDERQLLDLRIQGWGWAAIASDVGVAAETLRRRLSRALDRVVADLGLEDPP